MQKKANSCLDLLINRKNIAKSKRSQFKIQQMAFMLLAVFLFFILVSLFWLAIQYRNLSKEATELERERTSFLSEFLSGSSEFTCTRELGSYCIDTDKLLFFQERSVYDEFWSGIAFIRVEKLDRRQDKYCNKINYPDCNIYKVYENKNIKSYSSPPGSYVALCRYEVISDYATKICEMGKIVVGYETR